MINRRAVTLKSGGTVEIAVDIDPFKLGREDRDFLFGLVDRLADYEDRVAKKPATPRVSSPVATLAHSIREILYLGDTGMITRGDAPAVHARRGFWTAENLYLDGKHVATDKALRDVADYLEACALAEKVAK